MLKRVLMVLAGCMLAVGGVGAGQTAEAGESTASGGDAFLAIADVCAWPNLLMLPDGTILATIFNAPNHATGKGDIDMWASEDGGRTWSFRGRPGPHAPNTLRNHQAVGLSADGELIVVTTGWSNEYPEGESGNAYRASLVEPWVSISQDGGRNWQIDRSEQAVAPAPHGDPRIAFGNIIRGDDGALRMSMYTSRVPLGEGTGHDRAIVYRSSDEGRTWDEPVVIDDERALNETDLVHLGDGVWLAAARRGSGGGGIQLYRSTDDARTWEDLGSMSGSQAHPANLIQLEDERVLLVYGNRNRNPRQVEARLSNDAGETWTEPRGLAEWTGDGGYPTSVQREDGKIVTAYYAGGTPHHSGYQMSVVIWDADAR